MPASRRHFHFVGTFDFGGPNEVVRLGRNGQVEAIRSFGPTPLLGLGFAHSHVYVLNFGASMLQRLPANFSQPGVRAHARRR